MDRLNKSIIERGPTIGSVNFLKAIFIRADVILNNKW